MKRAGAGAASAKARLVVLLLVGCAHEAQVAPPLAAPVVAPERPSLRFERLDIERASLDGATFVFSWMVENPGPTEVTLSDWRPVVTFERSPLAVEPSSLEVTVPARATTTVTTTAAVVYAELGPHQRDHYAVDVVGAVRPSAGGRVFAVARTWRHEMPSLPRLSVDRLHVERRSESFGIELTLRLANPNPFPVRFERLRADVKIAGQPICPLVVDQAQVVSQASHELVFRCEVRKLALGGLARAALASTEAVSVDVNGGGVVEGRPIPLSVGTMIWPR